MKKVIFTFITIISLSSCKDESNPIIVKGEQSDFIQDQVDSHPTDSTGSFDFSQDEGVSDLLVYGEYEPTDSTDMFGPFLPGEMDEDKYVSDSVFRSNIKYIDSLIILDNIN